MNIYRDGKEIELTSKEVQEIYFQEKESMRHLVTDIGYDILDEAIELDYTQGVFTEETEEIVNSRDRGSIIYATAFLMNAFDGVSDEEYDYNEFIDIIEKYHDEIKEICKHHAHFFR